MAGARVPERHALADQAMWALARLGLRCPWCDCEYCDFLRPQYHKAGCLWARWRRATKGCPITPIITPEETSHA